MKEDQMFDIANYIHEAILNRSNVIGLETIKNKVHHYDLSFSSALLSPFSLEGRAMRVLVLYETCKPPSHFKAFNLRRGKIHLTPKRE